MELGIKISRTNMRNVQVFTSAFFPFPYVETIRLGCQQNAAFGGDCAATRARNQLPQCSLAQHYQRLQK